ncbi:MAG: Ig-like domain-containing protein [Gaiellaceae bacterium MAG52_C11]|nr:Ig-like domain-containing protein [Candidatus Gaiellasilicea maunaloa]
MKAGLRRTRRTLALLVVTLTGLVVAATALAAAPRSTSPPTVEGTYRQGSTLTTSNGLWANDPTSFTYRWQRCDSNGNNCAVIPGETARRYRLVNADVGRTIVSLVTARNGDGSDTANSRPTPQIADNTTPQNTREPSISGEAVVGESLNADPGGWTGAPNFQYSWLQCDAAGSGCSDTGTRGRTYGVRSADQGRTLRVQVRATNPRGTSTAISNPSAVVRAAGGGGGGGGSAVSVSNVSLPDRLVISGFASTPFRNRTDAVTLRIRVSDTRGRLVQGALVLASAVPFGRVTTAPETATDSNGIATISVRATSRLELQAGFAVQFFLRARKQGDNVLAGVSSRRLVQVPIAPG